MAATFANEGLDYILNVVPGGGTAPATLYLGLFTSQTASTAPLATAVLGASPSGITEAGFEDYVRVAVPAADWADPATETIDGVTAARVVTAAQKSFAAAGDAYVTAINGFFLASAATAGVLIYASNFSDTTAIASLALGDIIRVTPKLGLGNGA